MTCDLQGNDLHARQDKLISLSRHLCTHQWRAPLRISVHRRLCHLSWRPLSKLDPNSGAYPGFSGGGRDPPNKLTSQTSARLSCFSRAPGYAPETGRSYPNWHPFQESWNNFHPCRYVPFSNISAAGKHYNYNITFTLLQPCNNVTNLVISLSIPSRTSVFEVLISEQSVLSNSARKSSKASSTDSTVSSFLIDIGCQVVGIVVASAI